MKILCEHVVSSHSNLLFSADVCTDDMPVTLQSCLRLLSSEQALNVW